VLVWRSRFLLAAVLLGCAAALAVAQLRPAPPPQVAVVVAARPLSAGVALAPADVRVVHVAAGTAAEGVHAEPHAVLGRTPLVAVPTGLSIVDALLADDRLAGSGPPGTVVVPVRLADPGVADLLRPGDRVDLFAAATSGTGGPASQRLAERAVVLPHPAPDERAQDAASGLLGGAPTDDGAGTLTLVAVSPEQAAALAGASAWAGITAVLVE
jgi:Flp pilus assembly protein CpaB